MGNKVLKICCGTWKNASHDKRELSVYKELGEEIYVLAKGNDNDRGRVEDVDSFKVYRYTTRPCKKLPTVVNRVLSLIQWANFTRKIKPDVISGHDIDGLTIGWISNWFTRKKSILIYDSHEFELERNVKRSKLELVLLKILERHLINESAFMTVVNDEIGDEITELYSLREKPIVTRNMPYYWEIDEEIQRRTRDSILPENMRDKFIIMYHGVLMQGRGLEKFIELIKKNKNIAGIILGNGSESYINALTERIKKWNISDRVIFLPAVPIEELWKYVGSADVGMILAAATCKNHLYSLPNKFFENIHSGTPVICPDYPSMGALVDKYKIGLTCDPTSTKDLLCAIEKMRLDTQFYNACKKNCIFTKKELCWENESAKLRTVYQERILK